MWEEDTERLALLELLEQRTLKRRKSQEKAWKWLSQLAWTRRTSRRDELRVVEEHGHELPALLDRVWPAWKDAQARLAAAELPPTDQGWRTLLDLERGRSVAKPLPSRLNRRTATAVVAPHSKSTLSAIRRETLVDVDLTRDGLIRLRPSPGLAIGRGTTRFEVDPLLVVTRELVLTERSLRDGTELTGATPEALLLVENLGPYLDLTPPEGWLVAHVPGWNTATAQILMERLREVPVVHFGDLDPNGVRIVRHLRKMRPDLIWAVPSFWGELVHTRGLRKRWPDGLVAASDPELVRVLAAQGRWLEQETITLDPRLPAALAAAAR